MDSKNYRIKTEWKPLSDIMGGDYDHTQEYIININMLDIGNALCATYRETDSPTEDDNGSMYGGFTELKITKDTGDFVYLKSANEPLTIEIKKKDCITVINNSDSSSNSETTVISGGDKYGIRADYALNHGIVDCPNGLISISSTNKIINIKPSIVIKACGSDTLTTLATYTKYTIQEDGDIVLFFTKTESSSGDTQVGFLEAGNVFYQEEEPIDGTASYLAWYKPSFGLWQFKSNDTGNVWREAIATPIANVKATATGITSINYIGYRIVNDDIFAFKSDIENIKEIIRESNRISGANELNIYTMVNKLHPEIKNDKTYTPYNYLAQYPTIK